MRSGSIYTRVGQLVSWKLLSTYFNLVVFSALMTWYVQLIDFGGNQVAVGSLHICHDYFCLLIGSHCLSCATLHQALQMLLC